MNFVFFGSPRFAEIVLEKLIAANYVPSLVICNPDRPAGRKKVITPPPSKLLAEKNDVRVWQPEKLSIRDWTEQVGESVDFAVVAAYAQIIPREIVSFPRLGTIGVHPSLLPKFRGASPIQAAILEGEKETGVTLYLMDEKLDHGPILAQKRAIIGQNEAYIGLEERLANLGGELLVEVLPDFVNGKSKPEVQDESMATFTKKFVTEDAFVDYNDLLDAEAGNLDKTLRIHRMVLGFSQEPGAWTMKDGKRVKILESEVQGANLRLKRVQMEGEKPKSVT